MPDKTPSADRKGTPRWQVALNWALPVVLIAVFAWQVHGCRWEDVRAHLAGIDRALVAAALALLVFNSLLEILIWNRTLGWFTAPLSFTKATPVYIWSSLARYIPGKIASLLARVALAAEVEREVVPVLASSTVELALRIASGALLLLVALFSAGATENTSYITVPLVAIPIVLCCAHPRVMLPVMNWLLTKIKKPPITRALRYREVLGVFAMIIGRWVVYGAAFALLAGAITPGMTAVRFLVLICLAAGSWAIGFILGSPGGLGVAETVQLLILKRLGFSATDAAVLPLLFRLGSLASEGGWALVSVYLRRGWQPERDDLPREQPVG